MHDQISTPSPEWWAHWRTVFMDAAVELYKYVHTTVPGNLVVCPDEEVEDVARHGLSMGFSWTYIGDKEIRDYGHVGDPDVVAEVRIRVHDGDEPIATFVAVDEHHLEIHVRLPVNERVNIQAYTLAFNTFANSEVRAELGKRAGVHVE